jgi:uncharacterized protein YjbI with pentapeptide repeats
MPLANGILSERNWIKTWCLMGYWTLPAVLDGADFSNCWFSATFAGSSLRAVRFSHANVKCCDFSRADLTEADFRGAAMEAATLGRCQAARNKIR